MVEKIGVGKFKIFNVEVSDPGDELLNLKKAAPAENSVLVKYMLGTPLERHTRQIRDFVARNDSEWLRHRLVGLDAALVDISETCKVAPTLNEARRIFEDPDLTHEARSRKASEALSGLLERVHAQHGKLIAAKAGELHDAIQLVKMALAPDLSGSEIVREMRASETRDYVFAADKAEQAALVLGIGERGALEGLLALVNCPLGRRVETALLRQARQTALATMEVSFLLDQVSDAAEVLTNAATRADMIESAIATAMATNGVHPTIPSPWTTMIVPDLNDARTENIL